MTQGTNDLPMYMFVMHIMDLNRNESALKRISYFELTHKQVIALL